MNRQPTERLEYLDSLRAVAMLMVVGIHALSYVTLDGTVREVTAFIVKSAAVPIFFLCDGFLLATQRAAGRPFDYGRYMRRSAWRLLVPWAVFSLIYTGSRAVLELAGLSSMQLVLGQSPLSILRAIYASAIAQQLYFLLSLFLIRSFSFATRPLFGLSWGLQLLVFLAFTVGFQFSEDSIKSICVEGLDPVLHALWGGQFYLAGAVLARLHQRLFPWARYLVLAFFVMSVALWLPQWGGRLIRMTIQLSYILCLYFSALALTSKRSAIARVGQQSMGIYLLHAPVLLKLVALAVCAVLGHHLGSFAAVVLATYLVAWGAALLITKIDRLRFLFGLPRQRTG